MAISGASVRRAGCQPVANLPAEAETHHRMTMINAKNASAISKGTNVPAMG
jgi:hypothetical protein